MAKKKKSPYKGYTEEEVRNMENNYYCLVLGGDFILDDGMYLFTKGETAKLWNRTLRNLIDITENGEERDRKYAIHLIGGLIISPMRLH